jgi:hypothetical protein
MSKRSCLSISVLVSLMIGLALATQAGAQQFPILDDIANRVVQKYQTMTCEQLWEQKGKPKGDLEQRLVQQLRENSAMRDEFFRRVSVPIVTKMFECGVIP